MRKFVVACFCTIALAASSQIDYMPLWPLTSTNQDGHMLRDYSPAMRDMWVSGYVYGVAAAAQSSLSSNDLRRVSDALNRGNNALLLLDLSVATTTPLRPWYAAPLIDRY